MGVLGLCGLVGGVIEWECGGGRRGERGEGRRYEGRV